MSTHVMETAERLLAPTYKRQPVVFTRGKGCTLWDSEGRSYTDFVAGIAVCNLGHAHPRVAKALCSQAELLIHVSNLYYTVPQIELARFLVDHSFADRVFFANSGAEANEAAIKIARRYFHEKGEAGRFRIVTMEKSFHGRTMATLSATGQEKVKKGFAPLLEGFDLVPFNDLEALRKKVGPQTCAVLVEPIQGEGGICCPDPGYLQGVRRICDETGALLIFDEVQTGMGRTGKLFAYEHYGIAPDVMTLAKALANGLPIGAMLAREEVALAFSAGSHATTFGGTPVIAAAALEVVRTLTEEKVIDHCARIGAYFRERLQWLKERHDCIEEVRGLGLLLGLKLGMEGEPVMKRCLEQGFVINCVQSDVLRFVPPLVIGETEIEALIACLDRVLGEKP